MRGFRLYECGLMAGSALSILLFLPTSVLYSRVKPMRFSIPSKIVPLGQSVTSGEYAQVRQAIMANWEHEKASILERGPALGTDFTHIIATRIFLGALGEGLVVEFANSPQCGATGNCPMAVYVHGPNGYRRVISAGGWGFALLPSGGPVPDVIFAWRMSAREQDVSRFHYADGRFTPLAGEKTSAGCVSTGNSSTICASPLGNFGWGRPVSPGDYQAMRPAVEAGFQKELAASRKQTIFEDAHAMDFQAVNGVMATAVGPGCCDVSSNCAISIYAHYYHGHYWPLLQNARGWGVVRVAESSRGPGLRSAFVIARRLSPREDELTRYSVAISGQGSNLTPTGRLLPDACEIVTPKTGRWPAQWDAAALEARPVPCFETPSPAKIQIPAADTTGVYTVVQDSRGKIWGIGSGISSPSSHLYRWRAGGWSEVPSPISVTGLSPMLDRQMGANGQLPKPIGLWRGPSGGVLVQWLKSPSTQESELIWQRGSETKILASLPVISQPGMLGHLQTEAVVNAPLGTILIAGNGGVTYRNGVPVKPAVQALFRIGAKRQLQRIYSIEPDQYMRMGVPRAGVRYVPLLHLSATRDAQGKVWIWCGWQWLGGPGGRVFQGFLVTDGKTVEYHRIIPGMRFFHLASLDVWDEHHMAAVIMGQGLYAINTSTFEARHVDEPQPGAFFFAKKVFRVGADRYVLTAGPEPGWRLRPEFQPFLTGALWRLRDGQWKEILTGVGDASGTGLATPEGLWLATSDFHGVWFVPTHGPARRLDWREGLSLATASQLFRLAGGDILATGGGRSVEFHPAAMLARRPAPMSFSLLHPLTGLEADRRHNLWSLQPHGVLGEWNGSRWIKHPLPPQLQPERIIGLDVDTKGRVWLFPDCHLGPMVFFDINENDWSSYDSYPDALSARTHQVEFLHPKDDPLRPIYGPHSQIVFVGACGGVNYFNGRVWQLLQGQMLPPGRNMAIPPFFDSTGHLALNINRATWQWTPETRWQETSEPPPENYVRMMPNPFAPPPSPPEGCESPAPVALVKDSLGQSWWVAEDALYEGTQGKCRVVLSGSVPQPFIDGRRLVAAQTDARGNAFLRTDAPYSYIVVPRAMYAGTSRPRLPMRP